MSVPYPPQPQWTPSNQGPTGRINWGWLRESWNLFIQDAGTWIGAVVVYIAISFVVQIPFQIGMQASMVGSVYTRPGSPTPTPAQMLQIMPWGTMIWLYGFSLLLNLFMTCSLQRMALKKVRWEPLTFSDAFGGGPIMPAMLLLFLFTGIFTLAGGILTGNAFFSMMSAGAVPNATTVPQYVSTLLLGELLLVLGWVFALVFTMPAFAMVADRVPAGKAISTSFNAMKHDWLGALFFIIGAGFLLSLAMVLTCGLAMLATFPMLYIISALAYRDMVGMPNVMNPLQYGQPAAGAWPPPPTAWPPPPQQYGAPPQGAPQPPYYNQPQGQPPTATTPPLYPEQPNDPGNNTPTQRD